jgi:hypothetical protein
MEQTFTSPRAVDKSGGQEKEKGENRTLARFKTEKTSLSFVKWWMP